MSPRFAQPGKTIEVKGTITNHTGGPLYGVQVQLEMSSAVTSRSQMESFQDGTGAFIGGNIPGAASPPTGTMHNGSTRTWSASFASSSAQFSGFGVYPIVAVALSGGYEQLAAARTLLPYWPGAGSVGQKLDIAWVWPLIDVPQQSACRQTLASNELAASLKAGGRLSTLLSAGRAYSASTHLTWAVDPALLSDASTMTQRYGYHVGGNGLCTGTTAMPTSSAAVTWLSQLRSGIAGHPMFVTPYADADVSALTYNGLDEALAQSYRLGEGEADDVLGSSFGKNRSGIAWPADGAADASVLTSLARYGHVGTTVLSSSEMPPATDGAAFTPDDAVTRVTTGIGTQMSVLLADSHISELLGSASARSSAGAQFAVTQDFLAETAMILAEAPNSQRSVVIAPPRRWDPSLAEAEQLLKLTSAPWLKPVSLSGLASGRPDPTRRQQLPSVHVAPHQLGVSYMNAVKSVRRSSSLFQSLPTQPDCSLTQELTAGVAATESSAWRGAGNGSGWQTLINLQAYLSKHEQKIEIISKNKVLLAGNSGTTPVSVLNQLPCPVQVRVRATAPAGSSLSIGDFNSLVTVQANATATVGVPVHSAALGSSLIQLQLVTKGGTPLPGPEATQSLSVESTRYGRALLVLIAAALGVLLLTSVVRWTRRSLRPAGPGDAGRGTGGGGESGPDGGNEDGVSGDSALRASAAGSRPGGDDSLRATGRSGGTG